MINIAIKVFVIFVCASFLWFARIWVYDYRRWHIGMMSLSYAAAVMYIGRHANNLEIEDWVNLGFIEVPGCVGLYHYWKWQFESWKKE